MAKWIPGSSIAYREVHGSRVEQYNAIGGTPTARVRLEVPSTSLIGVKRQILGTPAIWPILPANNIKMYAVTIDVVTDQGVATTDVDLQLLNYTGKALIDVTYIARPGFYVRGYVTDTAFTDYYWEDSFIPKAEGFPMNNRVLMWGGPSAAVPTSHIPLTDKEAPVKYNTSGQLIHLIEGWVGDPLIDSKIGTTNQHDYTSLNLNTTFPAKTLMLRNYEIVPYYNFKSYRTSTGGAPGLNLRLYYEYRKDGWEKFRRTNPDTQTEELNSIRYNKSPYPIVVPFTVADHSRFLKIASSP